VSLARLSPRVRSVLVAAAVLAVGALGYFLLVSPKRSQAADLQEQIEATEAQIEKRRAESRSRRQAAPALDVRDVFRVTRAMPDDPRIPEVMLELDRLADRSGVSFESIKPQAAVEASGYRALPITVVADGKFFSVSSFIRGIRRLVRNDGGVLKANGRLLSVDSVSFAEGEALFPHVRATLTVKAFVFGGGLPAGGAAKKPAAADAQPLEKPPGEDS
jgi:Tfp pilus assembly protein PilO